MIVALLMTLYGRMVHHRGHANVFHVGTALVPDGLTMKASGSQDLRV